MLPVDQHMLIAAIAPRPCYVSSSSEDTWADPAAERYSCRLASRVYELYNKKGAILPSEPIASNIPVIIFQNIQTHFQACCNNSSFRVH